jgi:hypothetical protein
MVQVARLALAFRIGAAPDAGYLSARVAIETGNSPGWHWGKSMKVLALVSAMAVMAACSPAQTDAPAEAEVTSVDEQGIGQSETTAADGGPSYGSFALTEPDGSVTTETIRPDGTFTMTMADGSVRTGIWEQKSPEEFCTQDEGSETMMCFDERIDADGNWISVSQADGSVSTVERLDD